MDDGQTESKQVQRICLLSHGHVGILLLRAQRGADFIVDFLFCLIVLVLAFSELSPLFCRSFARIWEDSYL